MWRVGAVENMKTLLSYGINSSVEEPFSLSLTERVLGQSSAD